MNTSVKEMPTDKDILGYSRWWAFLAAWLAMAIISPYEYAWAAIDKSVGHLYGWDEAQLGLMFTLFIVLQSFGTLPGGMLRDKFGPKIVSIVAGIVAGVGLAACAWGKELSFNVILILWCIGSFFVGFVYNASVTTCNKWFPDKRALTAGLIAGAFSWGSLPFIYPLSTIPKDAAPEVFFNVIYLMAALIGGIVIVTAFFMKDPPANWKPAGWVATGGAVRVTDHQFTMGQALSTWQFWVLIISFILISSAGLTAIAKIMKFATHFKFTAEVAVFGSTGIAIMNGLGRPVMGAVSDKFGRVNTMISTYIVSGLFSFAALYAAQAGSGYGFLILSVCAIFFWGPLFSLFPAIIGDYYGGLAAGSNYGFLYAIAKGGGGIFGGVVSAWLIVTYGYDLTMAVAAGMSVAAGLMCIPLRGNAPLWKTSESAAATKTA